MVVHNAFSGGLTSKQVAAAVLFGDPLKSQPVGDLPASRTKEYCGNGDPVCNLGAGGLSITSGHLSYGSDADASAEWIIRTLGL
jgi:cutinase